MRDRSYREIVPDDYPVDEWVWVPNNSIPATPLQALMETAPGDEPRTSTEELLYLRQAIDDCLTAVGDEGRFLIEAVLYESLTQRQLADRMGLGKSHTNRLFRRARLDFEQLLAAHPDILERFPNMKPTTWEQAASHAILHLRMVAATNLIAPINQSRIEQGKKIMWSRASMKTKQEKIGDLLIDLAADAYDYLKNTSPSTLDVVHTTLVDRHHKYGPNNIREFEQIGLLVRMSDKLARLDHNREDFADDTYLDAYIDLIGDGAIAVMLKHGTFYLPIGDNDASL